MSLFKESTYERAKVIAEGFPVFQENLYEAQVFDIKVVEMQDTDWTSGHPVKTDKMIDSVEVTLKLLKTVDGELPKMLDGNETQKDLIKFWFDPLKLGFNKKTKEPTKGRQFLTAIQSLDGNAELTLEDLEKQIETAEFSGQKVKCFLTVITKEDGSKKNALSRFTSIGKKMDIEPRTVEETLANVDQKKKK